jgi:23S rRNA (adenine2030-N6)-methyltransferase
MNYRHAFHAGNFADVVKHAALTQLLARLTAPVHVIDTHAGAGVYDLSGDAAAKSGEAKAGILRLMAEPAPPPAFAPLIEAVRRLNPQGPVRLYPGSPAIACGLIGPRGQLTACELRPDDHGALENWAQKHCPEARALKTDGFAFAESLVAGAERQLVLIDPPFERAGDYARTAQVGATLARRGASVMIWLPLKDLETFDRFLRQLEDARAPSALIAELRLRPLNNPMTMNGCALVFLNAPPGLEAPLDQIFGWASLNLGENGASSRIWALSSN